MGGHEGRSWGLRPGAWRTCWRRSQWVDRVWLRAVSWRGATNRHKKREVPGKGRHRRVERRERQHWGRTNGKLLGPVGWGSPNKSFAVAETGLSLFLYAAALLKGPRLPSLLALVTPLLRWKVSCRREREAGAVGSVSLKRAQQDCTSRDMEDSIEDGACICSGWGRIIT